MTLGGGFGAAGTAVGLFYGRDLCVCKHVVQHFYLDIIQELSTECFKTRFCMHDPPLAGSGKMP